MSSHVLVGDAVQTAAVAEPPTLLPQAHGIAQAEAGRLLAPASPEGVTPSSSAPASGANSSIGPPSPASLPQTRANKACKNCARVKCKCIFRADGVCERCHRLSKACETSMTVSMTARKPRLSTKPVSTKIVSRSARLEAKLNDLVDLVRSTQAVSGVNPENSGAAAMAAAAAAAGPQQSTTTSLLGNSGAHVHELDGDKHDGRLSDAPAGHIGHAKAPYTAPVAAGHENNSPLSTGAGETSTAATSAAGGSAEDIPLHEAEASLQRFREVMLPLAPFIHIPSDATPQHMREQYPFLWRCIKAATCTHSAQQKSASASIQRDIVHHVVGEGERSLDVLLGMLTCLTWMYMLIRDRFQCNATMVAQMAVCVACDLGLTMPPLLEPSVAAERFAPLVQNPCIPAYMWRAQHSLEERRAVLGVFLVTSTMSQMIRSADSLRWSPYLDGCLAHLEQHSTIPQDAILVRHVRMQLLINQVRYSSSTSQMDLGSYMHRSIGSGPADIPAPYMDALRAQLDKIAGVVDRYSPAFDNFATHSLYHFAMLAIHESVLAQPRKAPSPSHTAVHPGQHPQQPPYQPWKAPDIHRFEVYQRCLVSVKAWLDRIFALPLQMFGSVPFGMFLQMFYVVVCLQKLTTIQDPAWNVDAVHAVVGLFPTIDLIISKCETLREMMAAQRAVDAEAGRGCDSDDAGLGKDKRATDATNSDRDTMLIAIRKYTTLKVLWQNELAAQERDQEPAYKCFENTAPGSSAMSVNPIFGPVLNSGPGLDSGLSLSGAAPDSRGSGISELLHGQSVSAAADGFGQQTPLDLFTGYSFDVLNYFHAVPDIMSDLSWP